MPPKRNSLKKNTQSVESVEQVVEQVPIESVVDSVVDLVSNLVVEPVVVEPVVVDSVVIDSVVIDSVVEPVVEPVVVNSVVDPVVEPVVVDSIVVESGETTSGLVLETSSASEIPKPVKKTRKPKVVTKKVVLEGENLVLEGENLVPEGDKVESQPALKSRSKKAPVKKESVRKELVKKESVKKESVNKNVSDVEEELNSNTRSFKVKLPGDTHFVGRFTGLTPYQAANKALSKHFRGLDLDINTEVQFSIKESTRGSKRHEYTYKGNRHKLDTPITYIIKSLSGEERVITKQYKNQLVKIKKTLPKQELATV